MNITDAFEFMKLNAGSKVGAFDLIGYFSIVNTKCEHFVNGNVTNHSAPSPLDKREWFEVTVDADGDETLHACIETNVIAVFKIQYSHCFIRAGRLVNIYKSRIVKKRSTAENMIKKLKSSPADFTDIRLICITNKKKKGELKNV